MLINILKSFFSKINAFVQWTKKWHIFHFVAIAGIATILLSFCYELITLYAHKNCIKILSSPILYSVGSLSPIICLALPFSVIMMVINFYKHNSLCVKNSFLLNNKHYEKLYIFYFFWFPFCLYCFYSGFIMQDQDGIAFISFMIMNVFLVLSIIFIFPLYILFIFILNKRLFQLKKSGYEHFSLVENIVNIIIFSFFAFLASLPILLLIHL